ncbi:MAG TPA: hypothetical protein VKE74_19225 [Gemmataceae bacterium]|nr:hypothetical protein [Gemmataceae bacterium]
MTRHRFAALLAAGAMLFALGAARGQEKKADPTRGTVSGTVTAKGDRWIEVRADGEKHPRRYVAPWKGGLAADGGGPDATTIAMLKGVPANARVKLDWALADDRPRIVKLEVFGEGDAGKKPEMKGTADPAKPEPGEKPGPEVAPAPRPKM